ncbi:Heat shock 70 kDa protein 12B [Paramyrothecium foliicola]|nr:Heat shock 70 kDa protein 12B [Paramyrothecium foliicola]
MGIMRKGSKAIKNAFNMKRLIAKLKAEENRGVDVEQLLVIGIDFGTTYSGAAWATIDDFEAEQINLITNWPGHGREEGKAPTAIYYDHDNGKARWGYDIEDEVSVLQWFKLLLLRQEDIQDDVQHSDVFLNAKRMLKQSGKSAVDVVADYLRLFWDHIIDTIQRDRGDFVVEALQLHVVLTVPAMWKGYARQAMKEAASKAGILEDRVAGPTTLSFAPEPEAAALASLCEPERSVDQDDVFVLCDAGGGTVDLVTYRVVGIDPIRLYEVGIGTGGLCGGIFIDDAFQNIIKARLGRTWNKLSRKGVKEIMAKEWEVGIKPKFQPSDTSREYIVSIPAEALDKRGLNDTSRRPFIKNGRIHFSSSDIDKAFADVFTSIGKLIDDQIRQVEKQHLQVTGIILVGGLGSSSYLHQYLSHQYQSQNIEVLKATGSRPRTAISRGAIFKGFIDGPNANPLGDDLRFINNPAKIVSTVARQSIGLRLRRAYKKGLHKEKDRIWNAVLDRYEVDNQIKWLIKKGQHVDSSEPLEYRCGRHWSYDPKDYSGIQTVSFIHCDDEDPPLVSTASTVTTICALKCRLGVPHEALADHTTPAGKLVKEATFIVKITPSGATMEFSVYYDGKLLESKDVDVEFE